MLPEIRDAFPQRRPGRCSTVVALVVLAALALGAPARAEQAGGAPAPFEPAEGVPIEWTIAMNEYVSDPQAGAARLIAIDRNASGDLPPMVQVVIADAYLRTGNRRAAQRLFEQVLASKAGYPFEDFGNLGMGAVRMMAGDTEGAETYFGRLASAEHGSSRVLGDLGLGSALSADGRFDEAREAFAKVSSSTNTDEQVRLAGRFGSATARYGSGDVEGALAEFEAIAASDPDGAIGQDARYAAARARLALGELDEGTAALRTITGDCDDERRGRRASRALRDLDPRAIGRTWVRNYQRTPWFRLQDKEGGMYSIDGCALARSTLRAAERGDASLSGVQRVSTGAAEPPAARTEARPEKRRPASEPAPAGASSSGWLPFAIAAVVVAALGFLWIRRARA